MLNEIQSVGLKSKFDFLPFYWEFFIMSELKHISEYFVLHKIADLIKLITQCDVGLDEEIWFNRGIFNNLERQERQNCEEKNSCLKALVLNRIISFFIWFFMQKLLIWRHMNRLKISFQYHHFYHFPRHRKTGKFKLNIRELVSLKGVFPCFDSKVDKGLIRTKFEFHNCILFNKSYITIYQI